MSDNNTFLAYAWGKTASGASGGAPTGEAFMPDWDALIVGFDNGWFSYNSETGVFISRKSFTAKIQPCVRGVTASNANIMLTYKIYHNGVSIATDTATVLGQATAVSVALARNDTLTMSCQKNAANPTDTGARLPQVSCGFTVEVSPE